VPVDPPESTAVEPILLSSGVSSQFEADTGVAPTSLFGMYS